MLSEALTEEFNVTLYEWWLSSLAVKFDIDSKVGFFKSIVKLGFL